MSNLTPNTRVALGLGAFVTVVGAVFYAGWFSAQMLGEIRDELAGLRRDVRAVSSDRWTQTDMERWSHALYRENRDLRLVVPDPVAARRPNGG